MRNHIYANLTGGNVARFIFLSALWHSEMEVIFPPLLLYFALILIF